MGSRSEDAETFGCLEEPRQCRANRTGEDFFRTFLIMECSSTSFDYYEYDMTLQNYKTHLTYLGETTVDLQLKTFMVLTTKHWEQCKHDIYAKQLRGDIDVRNDLLQITEGYWRNQQK
jgi:hypothetical protein